MMNTNRILPKPALGNHSRDAKNLALLLTNMRGGMKAYQKVFEALEAKYGREFRIQFHKEVHNANR